MIDVKKVSAVPLPERLNHLTALSREQLIDLWTKHFSRGPPKALSTSLLLRAMAYSLQERSLGGLKTKDQKLLARLSGVAQTLPLIPNTNGGVPPPAIDPSIDRGSIDTHKSDTQQHRAQTNVPKISSRPAPRSGTRLIRTWQGNCHIVDVGKDGFTWNGKVYASLTKVAFAITGARWSGPRFFRT